MSRPAVLTPRAQRELRHALIITARDNEAAARGLNDAIELAARRLGANPGLGGVRTNVPPRYRFWPLTQHSYLLVYDATAEPVRIPRVVHMARDLPRVLANMPPWNARVSLRQPGAAQALRIVKAVRWPQQW